MSLQYILGSSGAGKSTYIYERIVREAKANPDQRFIVLVPDQYTMETQATLVSMSSDESNGYTGCIMNIDILGFNRLAYRVFEELAMSTLDVLDDSGKVLVMRRLAAEHEDELTVLKAGIKRPKYIEQIKSLISELCQYNVTPERLEELIKHPDMSVGFRNRAKDLLVLYKAFLEFIDGRYLTNETILASLCKVLEDSKQVKDATIVFDGFTGFTPVQYDVMKKILPLAKKCYVTMIIDVRNGANAGGAKTGANEEFVGIFAEGTKASDIDKNQLFAMTKQFAIRLSKVARDVKVEIEEPIIISGEKGRFANESPLKFLEENIYRNNNAKYTGKADELADCIKIFNNSTPREELRQVAIEISRLIRNNGYHYSDIAVVCADPAAYAHMVPEMWDAYKIPYFLDIKNAVSFTPLMMMIDGLFGMLSSGFNRDFVFKYIRSGLCGITPEEADLLQNYVMTFNIRGNRYAKDFKYGARKNPEQVLVINEIRNKFYTPLEELVKLKKQATVREIATVFYNLLNSLEVYTKIEKLREKFESENDQVKADIYKQLYRKVLMLLDKLVAIIGDEVMSLEEFYEIYHTGLSGITVSSIPSVSDSVIFGDFERTRLSHKKAIFLIGAGDDAIPKPVENGGIISDFDRVTVERIAQEQGLDFELAPSDREKSFQQKFYLYLMLTKASEKLYITYPKINTKNETIQKSYLIDILLRMFGDSGLCVVEIDKRSIRDLSVSQDEAYETVLSIMREYADKYITDGSAMTFEEDDVYRFGALLYWLKSAAIYDEAVGNVFFSHTEENVGKPVMDEYQEAIDQENISGSVTRFEDYGKCAYSYFLKHILGIYGMGDGKLSSVEGGNFYHYVLNYIGETINKVSERSDIDWNSITDDELTTFIEEASEKALDTITDAFKETATEQFLIEKMQNTIHTNLQVIVRQVREGSFTPTFFEKHEKKLIVDDEGNRLAVLKCVIDRVDVESSAENPKIRIVDYKSGKRDLDLNDVYNHLSIQLPLYMAVAKDMLKDDLDAQIIDAAGMLYYHVKDEFFDNNDGLTGEALSDKVFDSYKMKGYVSNEDAVLLAHDSKIIEAGKSNIVPVALKKDGSVTSTSKVLTPEQFDTVIDYVEKSSADTAKGILNGQFDCQPYVYGKKHGCQYCPYIGICGFSDSVPGYERRVFVKLKDEEILNLMEGGEADGSGENNSGE